MPLKVAEAMTLSAWWLLAVAVPVILMGEWLVRHVAFLSRFSIPVPVAGGLVAAAIILAMNLAGVPITFATKVSAGWWTWLPMAESEWRSRPAQPIVLPLVVAFFTCVGLNASWSVARRGSWQLLLFLALATALAVLQNLLGVALARAFGFPPLLALMCSSPTLTGGPGTAMGFATTFEQAGLPNAGVIGAAAATFGIVGASLIGGPIATLRIRRRREAASSAAPVATPTRIGFVGAMRVLARTRGLLVHVLILVACMKAGAWVSLGLRSAGLTFPVYMGAMLCGIVVRNAFDFAGWPVVVTETIERLASVVLAVFLTMAMTSLNLMELSSTAGPMLVVLVAQIVLMALFAYFVTFNVMGRDYEAAVISGGHCGFGLGVTPNAVANMNALAARFGPAPRAFLVVTIVGAFLIDFTNAATITLFLNLLK